MKTITDYTKAMRDAHYAITILPIMIEHSKEGGYPEHVQYEKDLCAYVESIKDCSPDELVCVIREGKDLDLLESYMRNPEDDFYSDTNDKYFSIKNFCQECSAKCSAKECAPFPCAVLPNVIFLYQTMKILAAEVKKVLGSSALQIKEYLPDELKRAFNEPEKLLKEWMKASTIKEMADAYKNHVKSGQRVGKAAYNFLKGTDEDNSIMKKNLGKVFSYPTFSRLI